MIWFIVGLFILTGLILLLLSAKLKVELSYLFILEEKHVVEACVSILGFRIWHRRNNFRKTKKGFSENQLQNMIEIFKQERKPLKLLVGKLKIKRLSWITTIGTGDVISTGMSTGILWTIKEFIYFIVDYYANVNRKPTIDVKAIYQGVALQTNIDVKIAISIFTAFRLYKKFKKVIK